MAYIHLSIPGSINLDTKQNSQGAANTWTASLSGKSTWLPISSYSQGLPETWLPWPRSPSTALPLILLLSHVWLLVTKAWLCLPSWTLPHTVLGSSWSPVFWYSVIHAKMFKEKTVKRQIYLDYSSTKLTFVLFLVISGCLPHTTRFTIPNSLRDFVS